MSFSAAWRAVLDRLAGTAKPFQEDCFRSVELAYGDPDDVISGEGTRINGGRFAAPGVRAVFASLDQETIPWGLCKGQGLGSEARERH